MFNQTFPLGCPADIGPCPSLLLQDSLKFHGPADPFLKSTALFKECFLKPRNMANTMSSVSTYKDNLKFFIHQEIYFMSLMLDVFEKQKYFHFQHINIYV